MVSRPLSRFHAAVLGLVVMLGIGLAVVGFFAVGSRGWFGSDPLTLRAGFAEVRGVTAGTRVFIRGQDAGEVVAVERGDDDAPVVLKMRIRTEFRTDVREGATARIFTDGALGPRSVEIRVPRPPAGKKLADLPLVESEAMLRSEASPELGDMLAQVGDALKGLKGGDGTMGKLMKDPRAYEALVSLLESSNDAAQRGKDAMASVARGADAIKKVPFIGGYVEDPTGLLVRGRSERNRRVFAAAELFEPGRAVLTAAGRERLDEAGPWLKGLRHPGSDIVVAAYADPAAGNATTAQALSRQQAESVAEYLKDKHRAQKLGDWGWFSSTRKVTPLGQGTAPPPLPEDSPLPPARVEVVVFVPQG